MKIDAEAIKRHKILRALLKQAEPVEGEPTWENGPQTPPVRINGLHSKTLEVADDWKSAVSVSTDTFKTHYRVTVRHMTINGTRVNTDFDKSDEDPRTGIFYTDYDAAVKHLEDHRAWHMKHYPNEPYKGCGSNICKFCEKFAELGKVPESL